MIKDMDLISRLPVNHIILLALKDETIRQKLESNNEKIDWFFTRWRPTIIPTQSYIRYQFIKAGIFTSYILEDASLDPSTSDRTFLDASMKVEEFENGYEFAFIDDGSTGIATLLTNLDGKTSFVVAIVQDNKKVHVLYNALGVALVDHARQVGAVHLLLRGGAVGVGDDAAAFFDELVLDRLVHEDVVRHLAA